MTTAGTPLPNVAAREHASFARSLWAAMSVADLALYGWWFIPTFVLLAFFCYAAFTHGLPHPVGAIAFYLAFHSMFLGAGFSGLAMIGARDQSRMSRALYRALGAVQSDADQNPAADPGPLVAARPVLLALSTASYGFGFGLWVIQLLAPAGSRFAEFAPWSVWLFAAACAGLVVACLYEGADSTRRLFTWGQERAAFAATAEADANRARVMALQAQMHPHFLFNALNTVASLLGTDGPRAQQTVHNLSEMLKRTLERSVEPLTTFDDELQFVRSYLDIERERFGSRLSVSYEIDPATSSMDVPTMSLQPLVENAIKHAVNTNIDGGHITIAASTVRSVLRLSVEDDGPGFPIGAQDGTGLRNLRERLRTLYGDESVIETATSPSGARVTIKIPLPERAAASQSGGTSASAAR